MTRNIGKIGGPSLAVIIAIVLGGCEGITTATGPALSFNAPVPMLVNNVPNPRDVSLALQEYCGHLGIKNDDGSFETLYIPVYAANAAPKLTTLAPNAPPDYHSLLDQMGVRDLSATYGPASGSFNLSDEDRLEVSQYTTTFCLGPEIDINVIREAAQQLFAVGYNPKNVVIINQATVSQMTVNYLKSISKTAKGAATPIVNFGGSNFSSNSTMVNTYFVRLKTTPLAQALATPTGGTVVAMPQPNVTPSATPPAVAPTPTMAVRSMIAPQTEILPPTEFKAKLPDADAAQELKVIKGNS